MPPVDGSKPPTDGTMVSDTPTPTDAPPPPKDTSTGPTYSNSITVYVEPGDDADALYTDMMAATKSIHMSMYLLSDSRFIDVLTSKHKAGLDVKVVLNQVFPSGTSSAQTNASSYSQLMAAGVPVHWAPPAYTAPSGYSHEKCVILDGVTAWIMTMNLDYSAPTANREYLAKDTAAGDVAEAEAALEADYSNLSYSPSGILVVAPNNAKAMIVALIDTATKSIDVEDEEFSEQYDVAPAIAAAAKKGVATRLILSDDSTTTAQTTSVALVKAAGTRVVVTSSPYIHAKAIIVDGTAMYVGSENLTGGSLDYNRELGIITSLASEIAKVQTAINTDFSAGKPQ
jgi:phosphatidylserine/phosphatidylglycerophosphate/cardiolipin synthase-like enzyme